MKRKKTSGYVAAFLLLLTALLGGCATQPTVAPRGQPKARPAPPRVGAKAYDFALNDLHGNPVLLSDFRGKNVMVNFWATWCGPCRYEIPAMIQIYHELRDQGFEIVAVNVGEGPDKVTGFVERFGMIFPVLLDRSGKVAGAYNVSGIPTSIFVDDRGIIQAVVVGALTESRLRQHIDELVR